MCDKFLDRGNCNKTLTLAHFEPKGDRTPGVYKKKSRTWNKWLEQPSNEGSWEKYIKGALLSIKNSSTWKYLQSYFPKTLFTPSSASLKMVLDNVKKDVVEGISQPRFYSSHRDAQVAVQEATYIFNERNAAPGGIKVGNKTFSPIVVNDDVREALVKQVTTELEKARVAGKKIYLNDVISALTPGMAELAKRIRSEKDKITITAKSIEDSAEQRAKTKGYEPAIAQSSITLADFCKSVVGLSVPGGVSIAKA